MVKEALEAISQNQDAGGFIKVTAAGGAGRPVLSAEQKALLNRKGNELFNQGFVNEAERVFLSTGYSDGLSRVGDAYAGKGKELEALRLYLQAHNQRKAEPLLEKAAVIISQLIKS
jgi:hypothetical protein